MHRMLLAGIVAMAVSPFSIAADTEKKETPKVLSFKMKTLKGEEVDMSKYQGKVVLLVNVASQCGLTPQYEQLEAIHQKYKDKGLVVIGVPCNQFGGQEPGSPEEIAKFCSSKYNVTFDLLEKVKVNEDKSGKACDLYQFLTSQDTKPKGSGKVSWNFEKFLIDREGKLVARFDPKTKPDDAAIVSAIESALGK